jgi:alpha-L-fucosidase 2
MTRPVRSRRARLITAALVFTVAILAGLQALIAGKNAPDDRNLKLWYKQPAQEWTEALPVANGRLGAMVFGKTDEERIQLNEATLWSGGPYDPSTSGGPEALPEIRRLIFAGKYTQAHNLFGRTMMGMPVEQMKYQPLANLNLNFPGHKQVKDYHRALDLERAIASVRYQVGNVTYYREIFSTAVDQVVVVRLTADAPAALTFTVNLQGVRNPDHSNYGTDYFQMDGAPPDGLHLKGKTTDYLGIKGMIRYGAHVKALLDGGTVAVDDVDLTVRNANAVTLLFAAATNFASYNDVSGNPEERVKHYLAAAEKKSYEQLRTAHVEDYQKLFGRVTLDLGKSEASDLPTDERIKNSAHTFDPQLVPLFYQFGRYLLISSSRPGTQAANLQGIWNADSNPWWDSKYTTNINLEMNYWPAEAANLAECAEPLIKMVSEIAGGPGASVAKRHYNANGWVLHQNTDIWLACAPMDGPTWGTFSTGGAWLTTHLWDHYRFNEDKTYLKKIYPVMKGSAEFFLSTLVEEPTHKWLVTCPSTSPENFPKREGNKRYFDEVTGLYLPGTTICAGATIEMSILRALFSACIEASEILGVDTDFRERLRSVRTRLAPLQIGRSGELQEWLDDWGSLEPNHRHLSHLWPLYPGEEIDPRSTPELASAARRAIISRGEEGMSFSMAWRGALWARLLEGEQAYTEIRNLITSRTWPNLFSKDGKALQVDGNFGGTAAITEMLLQSHANMLSVLPALPKAWAIGSVEGLRARGGFEVSFDWKDGRLTNVVIQSLLGQPCTVRYGGTVVRFETKKGEKYVLDGELKRR